jgi:hypothetical protein
LALVMSVSPIGCPQRADHPCLMNSLRAYAQTHRRKRTDKTNEGCEPSVGVQFIIQSRRECQWASQGVERQPRSLGARPCGKQKVMEQTAKLRTAPDGQVDAHLR